MKPRELKTRVWLIFSKKFFYTQRFRHCNLLRWYQTTKLYWHSNHKACLVILSWPNKFTSWSWESLLKKAICNVLIFPSLFDVSHIHASFPAAITISYISTINLVDFSCVLFSYNIIKFEKETVFVVEATLRQQANYLPVIFAKSAMPLTATYTKCICKQGYLFRT